MFMNTVETRLGYGAARPFDWMAFLFMGISNTRGELICLWQTVSLLHTQQTPFAQPGLSNLLHPVNFLFIRLKLQWRYLEFFFFFINYELI